MFEAYDVRSGICGCDVAGGRLRVMRPKWTGALRRRVVPPSLDRELLR